MLHVVRADGTQFRAPPSKVGVEGELYTRLDPDGQKNRDIERWFSNAIDTPFANAFSTAVDLKRIQKNPFPTRGDLSQRSDLKRIGYILSDYDEHIPLPDHTREAIANYVAALLVRSPHYVMKLIDWHQSNGENSDFPIDQKVHRGLALQNMIYLYEVYRTAINGACINMMIADCDREFLFSDGGITAQEPWNKRTIPFDIYVPLTPKLALNVLPLPNAYTNGFWVTRVNQRGVARYNRIMLSEAKRFVFSRSSPPLAFIQKYFGLPSPSPFGSRLVNGRLETIYNSSQDKL